MAELDPRAAGARRLRDKVCVVTGAGQGIGRATARRLGEEGGKIVVAERIDESATRTTTELREHGVDATKVLADVSTFAGAQGLMVVSMSWSTTSVALSGFSPTISTLRSRCTSSSSGPCIRPCGAAWRCCPS
jgi:hypothetical protein